MAATVSHVAPKYVAWGQGVAVPRACAAVAARELQEETAAMVAAYGRAIGAPRLDGKARLAFIMSTSDFVLPVDGRVQRPTADDLSAVSAAWRGGLPRNYVSVAVTSRSAGAARRFAESLRRAVEAHAHSSRPAGCVRVPAPTVPLEAVDAMVAAMAPVEATVGARIFVGPTGHFDGRHAVFFIAGNSVRAGAMVTIGARVLDALAPLAH